MRQIQPYIPVPVPGLVRARVAPCWLVAGARWGLLIRIGWRCLIRSPRLTTLHRHGRTRPHVPLFNHDTRSRNVRGTHRDQNIGELIAGRCRAERAVEILGSKLTIVRMWRTETLREIGSDGV